MALDSLHSLFLDELKDVYHAEKQLVRALPRLAKAASDPKLQQAFTNHLKETQGQVQRLERVFGELGQTPRAKKCEGMAGLVEEGKKILEEDGDPAVIDAALIAAAQRVEHYEIAAYGCLKTYAQLLGLTAAARLLEQNLREEEAADEKLSALAEGGINDAAVAVTGDAEDED